jgi:hypothetical protein
MKKFKPQTLDEAITHVVEGLAPADRTFIQNHSASEVHFTAGMVMRNDFGLWEQDTPFKADIKKRFNLFGHGDDCSGLILAGVWATVHGEDVNKALATEAEYYRKHWTQCGVNPETGEETKSKRPRTMVIKVESRKRHEVLG